jgi:hypothetical protein
LEESQQQSCGEDLLMQSVRINEILLQGFGNKHLGPRSIGGVPMIQFWKRNQVYTIILVYFNVMEEVTLVMWSESGDQVVEFDLGHQGISDCIRHDILIQLCHIWIDSFEHN